MKISVLMGVYNCADTLGDSIESIINQTYDDWELIICDDGSKDNTYTVAIKYAELDERITVIKNEINQGLNITLNKCLEIATGEFIARMDGDDVCSPKRFEKQVDFLERNPQYAIVSSGMYLFDSDGKWGSIVHKDRPLPKDVVEGSVICHAPVMMRKECMDAVKGYSVNKRVLRVEDVDLWIKLYAEGYRCYNIPEELYGMRNDNNAFSRRKYRYRVNSTYVRLKGCRKLGLGPDSYIKAFRPMIIGLIPNSIRMIIRKKLK